MKQKYTFIYNRGTGQKDDILEECHNFPQEYHDWRLLAETRVGDIGVVFKEGSYYVFAKNQDWDQDKKDIVLERTKFKTKAAAMMYALSMRG